MFQRFLITAGSVGLLAVACAAPQAPAPGPATGGDAETPRPGGIFTKAIPSDFFDFDPTYGGQSNPNPNATTLAYDRLVDFKAAKDVKYGEYVLEPSLASKWEVSPDGKAFTFQLNKGVKFANLPPVNGREFTSADVKWSMEYHQRLTDETGKGKPKGSYTFTTENLERIDTPDAHTVVVRFKTPFAPFLNYAATYNMVMMPKEIYLEDGHLKNRMAGTGPYQIDQAASQRGTRWVFKKNPTYFQAGKPYIDEFRYVILPDEVTRQAAYKTKQIDLYNTSDTRSYDQLKAQNPGGNIHVSFDPAPNSIYIQQAQGPFADIRVRRALSMAIDRDEFIRQFSGGEGTWRLTGSRLEDFTEAEIKGLLKYDPEGAKKLLAEAGHPNGVKVKLLNRAADAGGATTQELLLQSQLKKAGFEAELDMVTKAEGAPALYGGKFDMILLYEKRFADVDSFLYDQNHSSGIKPIGQNASNWIRVNDTKLDRLIEAQRGAVDPAERKKALREVATYMTEQVYMLGVYPRLLYNFIQPHVKGYHPQDMQDFQDWGIKSLWIDK